LEVVGAIGRTRNIGKGVGTTNMLINAISRVLKAKPCLSTMIDPPIPQAWLER